MIRKTDPQEIAPYLKDASNFLGGAADEVLVPESAEELEDFLKANSGPITVAGAGTGLTASRIPNGGKIISLERFKKISALQNDSIAVEPAASLKDLQDHLQSTPFFYPPNPTETLASIGGTIATNASGSRSFFYGVTRDFVLELEGFLVDGRAFRLNRDQKVDQPLALADGSQISFPNVAYASPLCKNAAGFYVQPGMSWLDLFVGSDGTLGIITRARLKLLPRPDRFLSGILFFEEKKNCWNLVQDLRARRETELVPCSLEYFDRRALERLRVKFRQLPEEASAALFFEQEVVHSDDYDSLFERWYEYLQGRDSLIEESWFAENEKDLQKFHDFRHELPVIINEENNRLGRVKIGTDMAAPNEHFLDMMKFYERELKAAKIDCVSFGHIGDNHLHINLLPVNSELPRAKEVYQKLVSRILSWGGTVSAEHGIGKLKKEYFRQMVGEEALSDLRKIKEALDPNWMLGRGNIFDP